MGGAVHVLQRVRACFARRVSEEESQPALSADAIGKIGYWRATITLGRRSTAEEDTAGKKRDGRTDYEAQESCCDS
jgi:hypothetical protein